jgi:hypothetical protein
MPDSAISALNALTALANPDEFVIVDKSDTTMGVGGTNKRMPLSAFLADPLFLAALDLRAGRLSGRNLLDNGQLAINQRTGGGVGGVVAGNPTHLADRWKIFNGGVGAANIQYNTVAAFGGTIPGRPRPVNLQWLQMSTAEAVGSLAVGDFMQWSQYLEGQLLQHLHWGYADAQPLVYSFDIYSSVAATYAVELFRIETAQRSISRLITVPGGWSTQTVAFPGDTVGIITNDNTARIVCTIGIGAGTNLTSGTLQSAWGNVVFANRWPGITNNFATAVNNVFSITNAQLEVGTVATPYEVRRYDDDLRHCLRYFERLAAVPNYGRFGMAQATAVSSAQALVNYELKRAAPTVTFYSPVSAFLLTGVGGGVLTVTSLVQNTPTPTSSSVLVGVASGLVAGNATQLVCDTTVNAYIDVSAEI